MSKYFGGSSFEELSHAFTRLSGGLAHAARLTEHGGGQEAAISWEELVKAAAGFRTHGQVSSSTVSSRDAGEVAQQLADALAHEEGKVELRRLFRQLDTNGDGRVSSAEWARGMGKQATTMAKYFGGSTYEDLARAFTRMDTHGNGYLSWDEIVVEASRYHADASAYAGSSSGAPLPTA